MSITGKWKVDEMMNGTEDGMVWTPIEELLKNEDEETRDEAQQIADMVIEFKEDHTVIMMMKIPENMSKEELDYAVKEKGFQLSDDKKYVVTNKPSQWKTDGDKIMYNSGIEGEILGEKASSWTEVKSLDDGRYEFMFYKIKRI